MIALALILFFTHVAILAWLTDGLCRTRRAARDNEALPAVSVIIAARDEAVKLPACLEALARQTYAGKMQVIIVDDQSHDDTRQIAIAAAQGQKNWLVLDNRFAGHWRSSKKGALATALQHASGEVLLFTDADCVPPPEWIAQTVRCFTPETDLVAGYAPLLVPQASRLWRDFIRVDTLATAIVAAGSIGHGRGVTATGRNIACRRALLPGAKAYDRFPDSLSGDDDFLLQTATAASRTHQVRPRNPACVWCPESIVPARGPSNWRAFMKQKTRHLSAGYHYPRSAQLLYGVAHIAHVTLLLFFFIGLIKAPVLSLFFPAKMLLDAVLLGHCGRQWGTPISLPGLLLWELLYPVYQALAWWRGITGRPTWKEGKR